MDEEAIKKRLSPMGRAHWIDIKERVAAFGESDTNFIVRYVELCAMWTKSREFINLNSELYFELQPSGKEADFKRRNAVHQQTISFRQLTDQIERLEKTMREKNKTKIAITPIDRFFGRVMPRDDKATNN